MDEAARSNRTRLLGWAGMLTQFLSLQGLTQLCGMGTGLLIVRALGVREYAFYTVALTLQATLMVLADSGVNNVLSAIGGRVCEDRRRFGQLVETALRFRRVLEAVVLALLVPALLWMLRQEGADWTQSVAAALCIGVALHLMVSVSVFSVVPRLLLQANPLQRIELLSAGLRLGAVALLAWRGAGFAWMIAAALVGLLAQNALVRRLAFASVERAVEANPEDRAEMVRAFKHQLLNGIYYAFQPQLTLWVISIFGSVNGIAEVGALGRLSAGFALFAAVLINVLVPRFARLRAAVELQRWYLRIVGAVVGLGALLVGVSALFPRQILLVLGSKYAHLEHELVLMVLLSVAGQLVHAMWMLNASRAWIWNVWVNVPLTILTQVGLSPFLDLSTARGVIIFGSLSTIPTFVVNVALTVRGLREQARQEKQEAEARAPEAGVAPARPLLTGTQP